MIKYTKNIAKSILFIAFGFIILYFLYQRQNDAYLAECALKGVDETECNLLQKIWNDMVSANWFYIILSLILFTQSNISRAIRWNTLLNPLGYHPKFINSIGAISVAYLSNLGIPRSGEFVRAAVLSRYEKYEYEKVFGTIVIDRIADIIALFTVICIAFLTSFPELSGYFKSHPEYLGRFKDVNLYTIVCSLLVVVLLFSGIIYWLLIFYSDKKIVKVIKKKFDGLKDGVLTITKLERPWLFLFHTVVIWTCYYLMTYVVFFGFEPTKHLGPLEGLVVFVFGSFGIVIPSPGGMGTYHFLIGEALGFYGINSNDAFSIANILFFSIQLFCNILYGIIALILLPMVNKNKP